MSDERAPKPFHLTWIIDGYSRQKGWLASLIPRHIALVAILVVVGGFFAPVGDGADNPLSSQQDSTLSSRAQPDQKRSDHETNRLVAHGRYLASIAVCAACHTPPGVPDHSPAGTDQEGIELERRYKTDPDWFAYLDPAARNHLAGGVPFILRVPNLVSFAI